MAGASSGSGQLRYTCLKWNRSDRPVQVTNASLHGYGSGRRIAEAPGISLVYSHGKKEVGDKLVGAVGQGGRHDTSLETRPRPEQRRRVLRVTRPTGRIMARCRRSGGAVRVMRGRRLPSTTSLLPARS